MSAGRWPLAVSLSADIEYRADRPEPYRARVRWIDPATKRRKSKSQACSSEQAALDWIEAIRRVAQAGIDPETASMMLATYGESVMPLALRGLEGKTLDPYLAGWRKRVVPALGHLPLRMITNGAVDRAVHGWIAEQSGRSTVKNSLAVLVRVMEQAVRDGIMDRNPARVIGRQRDYQRAEDELDDPRSLALPDWQALSLNGPPAPADRGRQGVRRTAQKCPLTSAFTVISGLCAASGRPDLNRRPLDPQSPSGHRWVSPSMAHRAVEQPECGLSMAGRGLKPVHVGSRNGSPCRTPLMPARTAPDCCPGAAARTVSQGPQRRAGRRPSAGWEEPASLLPRGYGHGRGDRLTA